MVRKPARATPKSGRYNAADISQDEVWRERELERRCIDALSRYERAYRAGSLPAVYEALKRCRDRNVPVPDWAIDGSMRAIELLSPLNRTRRRGRGDNPILRFRQNVIHAARYYLVLEVREKQQEARQELRSLLKNRVPKTEIELAQRFCKRMGRSWEDAYEVASATLRGSPAFGSWPTIKKSYLYVKSFEKTPGASPLFMLVSPETLRRLGIEEFG